MGWIKRVEGMEWMACVDESDGVALCSPFQPLHTCIPYYSVDVADAVGEIDLTNGIDGVARVD